MLKLFAVVLGGRADGCNTELHDVVFVVAESIEAAYPQLISKWFGNKKRLHIDSFIELNHVDGHDLTILDTKPADNKKLFFVNFGAYKDGLFGETHENKFYVAASKPEILQRAKQELCVGGIEAHCDDNLAIDDILEVKSIDSYYLHFTPAPAKTLTIISGYRRLDAA